jgi:zinc transport system ATP-binding protein
MLNNENFGEDFLVRFNSVSKFYNKKLILENISFLVPRNGIITLVGPNGAGKTTIAKLLLGIEKPTSGLIQKNPCISFGYVPQKINLNSNMPIKVSALLEILTLGKTDQEILAFSGVDNIKDNDITEISGGQIRRVFLAACLINKANLIILDEPTKELDILGQKNLYQLLENIKTKFNVTVFMISHDLHMVVKSSDQVLCLNRHLCCYGKPSKQYQDILEHIGLYQHNHNHQHN